MDAEWPNTTRRQRALIRMRTLGEVLLALSALAWLAGVGIGISAGEIRPWLRLGAIAATVAALLGLNPYLRQAWVVASNWGVHRTWLRKSWSTTVMLVSRGLVLMAGVLAIPVSWFAPDTAITVWAILALSALLAALAGMALAIRSLESVT